MIVDSTLRVKDSVVIQKNFRVEQESKFQGNTKVEGQLRLPNLQEMPTTTNRSFLLVNSGGIVQEKDVIELLDDLGIYPDPPTGACDGEGGIQNPSWRDKPNILYSCPPVDIGIGTTTPKSKLDVRGTTYTRKLALNIQEENMEAQLLQMYWPTPGQFSPDKKLLIINNPEEELLRLENSGLLRAREIRIDASEWADFVFEENYQLTPLEELASFIKKEKHLPNIPRSEEVAKEGIDLAEMNAKLLEKVEELTLYVIEQNEKNKEQEEKLKALQKEVKQLLIDSE